MKALHQKYFFKYFVCTIVCVHCCISPLYSQKKENTQKWKNRIIAYPLAYYSPETRSGIGAAATLNFKFNHGDSLSPVSQISVGAGITQNHQATLSLPFALYFHKRTHSITGEVSYNKFGYDFYGIGGGNYRGEVARYDAKYLLFRVNYLYKFRAHLFAGLRWWYEDYKIPHFERNSLTESRIPGIEGSRTSGPGIVFLWDDRDDIYYSTKGNYLEISWQTQSSITGSNYFYDRYRLDYRVFMPLTQKLTLANNVFGDFIAGDVPFSQMPALGAGRRGRGYYMGRYRDKNLILYQVELRKKMDQKWAITSFLNYGILSGHLKDFNFKNDHSSFGFGLRYAFDPTNKTNLRLDFAWPLMNGDYFYNPDKAMKVYFTVNEAF